MAGDEVAPQQPPQQSIRTIELPSYPPFNEHESPSIATDWEEWIEGLDAMFDAMCLTNDQDKFSKLYHYLGNTRRTLRKLDDNGIQQKSYTSAKTALTTYFCPKCNVIFLCNQLYTMRQNENEPMDVFYMRVKEQVQLLDLTSRTAAEINELLILAQLVNTTNEPALRTKALKDSNLKLKHILDHARAYEMANKQAREISGESNRNSVDIDAVKRHRTQCNPAQRNTKKSSMCYRCGLEEWHPYNKCAARNATCNKCGTIGHYGTVCMKSKHNVSNVEQLHGTAGVGEDTESEAFLGMVATDKTNDDWNIKLWLAKIPFSFRIDTGADVTCIPASSYTPEMGRIDSPDTVLTAAGNTRLCTTGMVTTSITKSNGTSADLKVYLVESLQHPLLGQEAIKALDLIQVVRAMCSEKFENKYKDHFTGLGNLCEPYRITLRAGAKPVALTTARHVPIPLLEKVREELQSMESSGIISRVQEPTEWCSDMVMVPKSNGRIRICVDLSKVNESVEREYYLMPAVDETLAKMCDAKIFSKLNANNGFWQIKLHPDTAKLTTFITPFGRYFFNCLPFGLNAASEHFMRKMSQILDGQEGVVCQVDDILVYGKDAVEHDKRLNQVMERLKKAGVTLNRKKCKFAINEVNFLGHVITSNSIKPDPEKLAAILEMEEPEDVSAVRRFLGMINYLRKFIPHVPARTKPLRDLLNKHSAWTWDHPQKRAFNDLKTALGSPHVLQMYNPKRETVVSADASQYSLGAVILQCQDNGELQPIAYASRFLTKSEQNYGQIDKQALAVTWACEHFYMYILGKHITLETDHKPLIPLFSTKHLDDIPIRIQRFRIRLMRYDYNIVHVPGKELIIADALSRAPRVSTDGGDLEQEVDAYVNLILETLPATERRLQEIKTQLETDPVLQQVTSYCRDGWPDYISQTPGSVQPYWNYRAELTVQDGLLLKNSRIVIPSCMRLEILDKIHAGHQGIVKCRERAKNSVWWPGLSKQLKDIMRKCTICSHCNVKEVVTAFLL